MNDRAARTVHGGHAWPHHNGPLLLEQAQTQIVVLVIQKEPLVEEAHALEARQAKEHRRADHKTDADRSLGAGSARDPSGAGPAVVHIGTTRGALELRRNNRGLRHIVRSPNQLAQALRGHLAVGIKQQGQWRSGLGEGAVVRRTKTEIATMGEHHGVRPAGARLLGCAVLTAIVRNDHVRALNEQSVERFQTVRAVISDHHHRHLIQWIR